MAWTNLTFSFGQVLTSAQMTQLDDNFEAMATGVSGAPVIEENALTDVISGSDGSISRTGTVIGTTTLTATGWLMIAFTSNVSNTHIEVKINGTWRSAGSTQGISFGGLALSDGSNIRINQTSTTAPSAYLYWQRIGS